MNKIKLKADYHTHTFCSDGHASAEENVKAAVAAGLHTIAITDHGPFHARRRRCSYAQFLRVRDEIMELRKKYPIKIMFGVEMNLVSLNGAVDLSKQQQKIFDIIVLGTHRMPHGYNIRDFFCWKVANWFPPSKKRVQKNTEAYLKAMRTNDIKILAHLNYGAKVDVRPIARLAAEKDIWIELNGRRVFFTEEEIQIILEEGANFVLNSDAHRPENVGKPTEAWKFLEKYHIPKERIVNI